VAIPGTDAWTSLNLAAFLKLRLLFVWSCDASKNTGLPALPHTFLTDIRDGSWMTAIGFQTPGCLSSPDESPFKRGKHMQRNRVCQAKNGQGKRFLGAYLRQGKR